MMEDRFRFRAWDKQEMEMIYSGIKYELRVLNIPVDNPRPISEIGFTHLEQRFFTIMQCTGLKDKAGKLIYEGDIILGKGGMPAVIIWHNSAWFFLLSNGIRERITQRFASLMEIIGNTYQNPERLTPTPKQEES